MRTDKRTPRRASEAVVLPAAIMEESTGDFDDLSDKADGRRAPGNRREGETEASTEAEAMWPVTAEPQS